MKYTISEERLANLIKKYITHLNGKLTVIDPNHSYAGTNIWLENKYGVITFAIGLNKKTLFIDNELYKNVAGTFGLHFEPKLFHYGGKKQNFLIDVFIDYFNSAQDNQKLNKEKITWVDTRKEISRYN